ncbi:Hsp20 family protein [Ignisphaera sp. 4213-co]|uniref:Hsp20 family protein n=1 Tax=Ignisphaera cupida TaxID=3050454 RepID=A0ABD4Z7Z6_9CREN|nr:Hsp20 family protein [Ignisphaera sp. 4213-co]MDK6029466.1 Hsp20 family protein [Ignisphaera sp. 4213-co]
MIDEEFEKLFRKIREVERSVKDFVESEFKRILDSVEDVMHIRRVLSPTWYHEGYLRPLYTVYDRGSYYEILIDLPKVDEGSIDVRFQDNLIYIRARLKEEIRFSNWSGVGGETRFHEYREVIEIPIRINPEKVRIQTRRGLVKILVYK